MATGRKINGREGFTALFSRSSSACGRRIGNDYRSVILQLVKAAVGHHIAGIDAINLRLTRVRNSGLYAAHVRDVVLNHVHKRCLAILLNRGGRNERDSLQRVHQQARVHKLIREERVIFVVEDRPPFYRSGSSIYLVIER